MEYLKTDYESIEYEPFYSQGISPGISSNGQVIAFPFYEDVKIIDIAKNEMLYCFKGDETTITNICMSRDGKTVAIFFASQQFFFFDICKKEVVKKVKMTHPVYISTIDQTSSYFGIGGIDGQITIWSILDQNITHSLTGHSATLCSLNFYTKLNSNICLLISGDVLGQVRIWELGKKKCIKLLNDHTSAVRGVSFDEECNFFLTAGRDEIVNIYKFEKFRLYKKFLINESIECSGFLNFNKNGNLIKCFYTAGVKNIFKIWNFETGELVAKSKSFLETTEDLIIIDLKVLTDGNILLVLSDQSLVFLDIEIQNNSTSDVIEIPEIRRISGNHGVISGIKYVGPNHDLIALLTNSPNLRIICLNKPFDYALYEGHTDLLTAMDLSVDGKWIVTGSKDNSIIVWYWDDNKQNFIFHSKYLGHSSTISSLKFSKNKNDPLFLISGSNDLTIKKWMISGTINSVLTSSLYTRKAHDKQINAIDISNNNEFIVSVSNDMSIKIWNSNSGELLNSIKGHKRKIWDVCFDFYNNLIATAGSDNKIKIWSLKNFKCLKSLEGHINTVQRVLFFNKNSTQLITADSGGLIKIWDFNSEENIKTYDTHNNKIWGIDVKNYDGSCFLSSDVDGFIYEWNDVTDKIKLQIETEKKIETENTQKLTNLINEKNWSNAFLLALNLNHSMKLYTSLKSCIEFNQDPDSIVGSFNLEETIHKLTDDQIVMLFKYIRNWNTNFKYFQVSQKLLKFFLSKFEPERFKTFPNFLHIIESIIPYNQRHYERINSLVEKSYILDFILNEMNNNIS